jgi:hypothetical protein
VRCRLQRSPITLDRYGHLMPGNEDEAAALLDAYLERADTRARLAGIGGSLLLEVDKPGRADP